MIDYLFAFDTEDTAHAALDPLGFGFPAGTDPDMGDVPARWDASRVLPVQIGVGETQIGTDEDGNPIMQPVYAQGFWIVVSTLAPNDDLWAIPYCMREADRDRALAGQPYVNRERFTPEQLAAPWVVTPQWCGVSYANLKD